MPVRPVLPARARRRGLVALLLAPLLALLLGAAVAPTASAATPSLQQGSSGSSVRDLQTRLAWAGIYSSGSTGYYGPATTSAVRHFQEKFRLPQTGRLSAATLSTLKAVTYRRGVLPATCRTGKVICIDKTQKMVRNMVSGKQTLRMDARFGAPATPTREGLFSVFRRNKTAVSSEFGSSMPYAMTFSGGEAIHYSYDFAARGYAGASHGCVNTRDRTKVAKLFDLTPLGRRVYVYH